MTIRCEQFDDLLLEGDELSMQAAAEHAESCPRCNETLADWNEISATAKSMKTTWPSDLLWPRIEKALRAETRSERAGEDTRAPRFWRIAAVALLTIGVGASTWFAVRDTSRDAAFNDTILRVSALDDVERAEQAYVAAIERLEHAAEPQLEESNSELMASYKEKLMILDDAIAEVQMNIDQNKQNAHLRRQLLAMYSEKQRTLQAVVREGDHASNE